MKQTFATLNELLKQTDISKITAESSGFDDLPDGYYLTEVMSAVLKQSSTGFPMVALDLKAAEDGHDVNEDGNLIEIPHTKNRHIYLNYVLKDEASVKRFVNDMLKFEGDTAGEPLLQKEYFTTSDTINDALDILVGCCIYINVSRYSGKDGTERISNRPITWKRAAVLELPL